MQKKKNDLISLILLAIFPWVLMAGGLFFCCRNTGFRIDKITSRLGFNYGWEVEPLPEKQRELLIQKIFPQKFYYLASGNQCYAFISEDREYILKFFKMKNLFPKDWLNNFPLSILQRLGLKLETSNQFFSERIFENYKAAYESLRKETGLLYIHLNKTSEFTLDVTLIDNKEKKYFLNLDNVEFIVQRRAQKIYEHLDELVRQSNDEELKMCIRSFLQLIASRCEKGFADQNLSIRNNFGFVGNQAIQIDCATLTRDNSMKYPLNFRNEVLHAAERLDVWAQENYPEATLFIQEEAQKIINHSF
jgi:hypothetical protein